MPSNNTTKAYDKMSVEETNGSFLLLTKQFPIPNSFNWAQMQRRAQSNLECAESVKRERERERTDTHSPVIMITFPSHTNTHELTHTQVTRRTTPAKDQHISL